MLTWNRIMIKLKQIINEVPVDVFQTIGDFEKGSSYKDRRDRDIIRNPVTLTKVKDFFKNTTVDFDFYFVNLRGRRRFAEKGEVKEEFLFTPYPEGLGITREQLKNGSINKNNITVFFVGNTAAEKIPMTAWTIAHRFGHSVRRTNSFNYLSKWIEGEMDKILQLYNVRLLGTYVGGFYQPPEMNSAKSNLFNQIGTMRSAREGKIKRYFEFYYELFAQYLKEGKITLNRLKPSIRKKYGAYGREEMAYTKNIESVNEILEGIERDFQFYAEDVLGELTGKIFVM